MSMIVSPHTPEHKKKGSTRVRMEGMWEYPLCDGATQWTSLDVSVRPTSDVTRICTVCRCAPNMHIGLVQPLQSGAYPTSPRVMPSRYASTIARRMRCT